MFIFCSNMHIFQWKKLVFVNFFNIRKNIKQAYTKDLRIFAEFFFRNCNDRFPEKRKMYWCYLHMLVVRSLLFLITVGGGGIEQTFYGGRHLERNLKNLNLHLVVCLITLTYAFRKWNCFIFCEIVFFLVKLFAFPCPKG